MKTVAAYVDLDFALRRAATGGGVLVFLIEPPFSCLSRKWLLDFEDGGHGTPIIVRALVRRYALWRCLMRALEQAEIAGESC